MIQSQRIVGTGKARCVASSGVAHWVTFKTAKENTSPVRIGGPQAQNLELPANDWICLWPCAPKDTTSGYTMLQVP